MRVPLGSRNILVAVILIAGASLAACNAAPAAADKAAADEVTGAWVKAFDSGDAKAVAALYAEDARSFPPDSGRISGRDAIESYWRGDIGSGGAATKLTPTDSVAQRDLLHVEGLYEVSAKDGGVVAKGQYQQLWKRVDNQWKVQHEIWRLDPSLQRNPDTADRLESLWTAAYNAQDSARLAALYHDDAVLSTRPTGSLVGRNAIASFWKDDFGDGKPSTKLALADVYMAGGLAHLEGEYEVSDKGKVTKGHYVQLWMQDDDATWRIHREMWWQ